VKHSYEHNHAPLPAAVRLTVAPRALSAHLTSADCGR